MVFVFLSFEAPILLSPAATDRLLLRGGTALAVFAFVVVPVLIRVRRKRYAMSTVWLRQRRKPTDWERRMTLGAPGEAVRVSALTWGIGAVFFAMLGATESVSAAAYIFSAVILGGITTTAVWYLIAERIMRPVSARALDGGPAGHRSGQSIQLRLAMAWTLATGVPLLGVAMLAVGYLVDVGFEPHRTLAAILGLVVVALVVGLFTLVVATRSVAERVGELRRALARVRAGDFAARVVVDDASEIGRLQVGFNAMTAGLAERERIREVFGIYVDRDVAEHILQGAALQGDEVEVTLMFVDVRSFTTFAERLRRSRSWRLSTGSLNGLFRWFTGTADTSTNTQATDFWRFSERRGAMSTTLMGIESRVGDLGCGARRVRDDAVGGGRVELRTGGGRQYWRCRAAGVLGDRRRR